MSRSFRMQGGSQGESQVSTTSAALTMLQPEVDFIYPRGDRQTVGRFLPARDMTMNPEDTAYATSVIPYRDSGLEVDRHTNTPGFTSWFAAVKAYRFFGRENISFISPQTLAQTCPPEDCADPIADIFRVAKSHHNPAYQALIKRPEGSRERSVVPRPDQLFLYNMYISDPGDGNKWKVAVVTVSKKAHLDLKDKLSQYRNPSTQPYDADFPDFLFGDITHPQIGLQVSLTKILPKDNTPAFNGFMIGTADNVVQGTQPIPVNAEILAKRFDLFSDKVLRIPEYAEIVNYLVREGSIPHALIEEACGHMCDVPRGRTNTTVSAPAAQTTYANPQPATSVQKPASMGPKVAATQPNVPQGKFWVSRGGASVEITGAALTAEIEQGIVDPNKVKIMPYDQSASWAPAVKFGFKAKVVAAAPPPPPEETDNTPPPPPVDDEDDVSYEDESETEAPATGKLTPEEQARYAELQQKSASNALNDPSDLTEFMQLIQKIQEG